MDLLEHQGKQLFRRWGVPTPGGRVAETPGGVVEAARELGWPAVVKAQVRTGGRGKAGGIRVVHDEAEARAAGQDILALTIKGLPVEQVLVESGVDIASEMYLSLLADRSSGRHLIVASSQGGMDIEQVAASTPDAIARVAVDPLMGLQGYQVNRVVTALGVAPEARRPAGAVLRRLWSLYTEADATLVEVNPLVVTTGAEVLALDSKVSLDDSARFRHPEHEEFEDAGTVDPVEREAAARGLSNFVALDGEIGIIGNGAGLVMSTLDLVDQVGGRAANFLDVGGGADAAVLSGALQLILSRPQVRAVLVNIFGGITRCDLVAEGVLDALSRVQVAVPVVIRLAGTNAEAGLRLLEESRHPRLIPVATMMEAAQRAVAAAAVDGPGAN